MASKDTPPDRKGCAKQGFKDHPNIPFTMDYFPDWASDFLSQPRDDSRFRGDLELGVCAFCMVCNAEVAFYEDLENVGGPNLVEFPEGFVCPLDEKGE